MALLGALDPLFGIVAVVILVWLGLASLADMHRG
jgi:hypothetical protein